MRVDDAVSYADDRIREHGLHFWYVRLMQHKRIAGWCAPGVKTIWLSSALIELNDSATIQAVIDHEIAHAVSGHLNHDRVWRETAARIGGGLAAMTKIPMVRPPSKYELQCPVCGAKEPRERRPRHGAVLFCRACRDQEDRWVGMVLTQSTVPPAPAQ